MGFGAHCSCVLGGMELVERKVEGGLHAILPDRHSGSPDRVRRNEVFSGSDTYGEITIEDTRQ